MKTSMMYVRPLLCALALGLCPVADAVSVSYHHILDGSASPKTKHLEPNGESVNEDTTALPIGRDGNLVSLAINPVENSLDGPATFTLRINEVDTALSVTVPEGSTSVEISQFSIPISAGDRITLKLEFPTATTGTLRMRGIWETESDAAPPPAPLLRFGHWISLTLIGTLAILLYLRNRPDVR